MKDGKGVELKIGSKVILRGTLRSVAETGDPNTETVTFVMDIPVHEGTPHCFYLRPGQVEAVTETPGVRETPPTDPAGFMGKGAESLALSEDEAQFVVGRRLALEGTPLPDSAPAQTKAGYQSATASVVKAELAS